MEYVCGLAELDIEKVYKINPEFMRPADVPYLKGDYTKAKNKLGWEPKDNWETLLEAMYKHDFTKASREVYTYR